MDRGIQAINRPVYQVLPLELLFLIHKAAHLWLGCNIVRADHRRHFRSDTRSEQPLVQERDAIGPPLRARLVHVLILEGADTEPHQQVSHYLAVVVIRSSQRVQALYELLNLLASAMRLEERLVLLVRPLHHVLKPTLYMERKVLGIPVLQIPHFKQALHIERRIHQVAVAVVGFRHQLAHGPLADVDHAVVAKREVGRMEILWAPVHDRRVLLLEGAVRDLCIKLFLRLVYL